jgi:hypothetical protein
MKKYEGNKIIKKIIDSDFTCEGINRTSECPDCPFIKKCPDTSRETRQKVLEFILYEILEQGFDFCGNWNEAQATKTLIYYTSDTELWKSLSELYEEKYAQKLDEQIEKAEGKKQSVFEWANKNKYDALDLKGYTQQIGRILNENKIKTFSLDCKKMICSNCGKECHAVSAPRNPDVSFFCGFDAVSVSNCCKAKINYEQPVKKDSPGYYVFNRQGVAPQRIHDTYESALGEAIRLSKKHHNNSFVVCQIKAEIKQEIKTLVEEY